MGGKEVLVFYAHYYYPLRLGVLYPSHFLATRKELMLAIVAILKYLAGIVNKL